MSDSHYPRFRSAQIELMKAQVKILQDRLNVMEGDTEKLKALTPFEKNTVPCEGPVKFPPTDGRGDGHGFSWITVDRNYDKLFGVLNAALQQAQSGKGHERHSDGQPFHEQPICAINRLHGSIDGALFQASKKAHEARRLPRERAVAELLGAINYLAAAVILVEEGILDSTQ